MQRAEKVAVSGALLMLFKLYIFTSRASEHRGIYADLLWLKQSQCQPELDRKPFIFSGSSEWVDFGWVYLTQRVCSADTGGLGLGVYGR
jgi:hypothetical protein